MIRITIILAALLVFTGCQSSPPKGQRYYARNSDTVDVDVRDRSVSVQVRPPGSENVDIFVTWP
ncbi:MAG: hypothetical protein ACYTBZ_03975 [Planctomycetota bacterium]|jgi:hypothetical protein